MAGAAARDGVVSTRDSILRATLKVVGEVGVGGLTNRRIVAAAGVSLGTLTYHFPSQTELLREAMLLFAEEETAKLTAIVDAHRADGLDLEQGAAVVEQVIKQLPFGTDELAPHELYLQAARDPALREASSRCFAAYDDLAIAILRALGVAEPERLAGHVVALIAGLQLRRFSTGVDVPAAEPLMMLLRGAQV
ncbi:TetR/AcrR family transcriptional regulator [Amycolatopsis saalfeldensis]|uniref:DNA-binding transcriptional regulator YbjK n=1 Tax=Amycolatopsis saalfeldensis TaxID=394193 RepID=A0A1H8XMJ3_9PSEU|nr:TetR family transcriptional regulator [Amycolatopsis saalfeldensis]SEP40932.1 DNA-binding transcriptional regulator YbjK [Amycolatopsis saalfeldensis]